VHLILGRGTDGVPCTGATEARARFISVVRGAFVQVGQAELWARGWEQEERRGIGSLARLAFVLFGGGRLRVQAADTIPSVFMLTWGAWGGQERARQAVRTAPPQAGS
jgi:hypothetical protein